MWQRLTFQTHKYLNRYNSNKNVYYVIDYKHGTVRPYLLLQLAGNLYSESAERCREIKRKSIYMIYMPDSVTGNGPEADSNICIQ